MKVKVNLGVPATEEGEDAVLAGFSATGFGEIVTNGRGSLACNGNINKVSLELFVIESVFDLTFCILLTVAF